MASALGQTLDDIEVVVVDDGSVVPVELEPDPRVRVVRHDPPRGVPGARNAGLAEAAGRYVTFLDDDNLLLPGMAERSLAALERSELPPPVAVVSGVEVVGPGGRVLDVRLPPSHPRGEHYSLEPLPPGRSHMSKHTLVAERELLDGPRRLRRAAPHAGDVRPARAAQLGLLDRGAARAHDAPDPDRRPADVA